MMAKLTRWTPQRGYGPPDPRNREAFASWLAKQPREWSVALAARAALRVLPIVLANDDELPALILMVFRATAIARFAAKYPNRAIAAASASAASAPAAIAVSNTPGAASASYAAYASAYPAAADAAASASYAAAYATYAAASASGSAASAIKHDARRLYDRIITAEQLTNDRLWRDTQPPGFNEAWGRLKGALSALGRHWVVWSDWYEYVALHPPKAYRGVTEAQDAAFTDIPGELPWDNGAEAVNAEIARRLADIVKSSTRVPDQSPAPVRVEERNGKISQQSDRDSPLNAVERDFRDWRDPVLDHIGELTETDFATGTNHARMRDRLTALGRLLPGEVFEVKERQFWIGYEIERFEGLLTAYRSDGEDMPKLNVAQLEDLGKLRIALRMGIDKLQRWVDFSKRAAEDPAGEGNAEPDVVAGALEDIAASMEKKPEYFHPELPASFRFLAESARDPRGATKTVVYGAVKSAENLFSFLGQRALAIGKRTTDAVEAHISKAVAASLIAGFSTAALALSGALPQGWAWLKPLLAAISAGG
jgi:hypothetical protein